MNIGSFNFKGVLIVMVRMVHEGYISISGALHLTGFLAHCGSLDTLQYLGLISAFDSLCSISIYTTFPLRDYDFTFPLANVVIGRLLTSTPPLPSQDF